MIARVAVATVAIGVLAWLAIMERDARLQARVTATPGNLAVPATLARDDADLRDARLLDPDTTPDLIRAFAFRGAGQPARSAAILKRVVRNEPDNLLAWSALLTVSTGRDPVTARRARAELRRLDPMDARRR